MSKLICKICNNEVNEDSHYWKTHKITMAKYFVQYYGKKSLLTGEPIEFKSKEQYLLSDFNNRYELQKWLLKQTDIDRQKYLKDLLLRRKDIKGVRYAFTQAELRSIDCMPGIITFNQIFKNYYAICKELGFIDRGHNILTEKTILKPTRTLNGNPILIDSREQNWLSWGKKAIEIATLPVGDYTIKNNNHNIYIERKSLNDFISTLGINGLDRFKRELQKAKDNNLYIIMLVESGFSEALSFEYQPHISRYTKATAKFIFHNLRELLQEFPMNFQIGFCQGRNEMKDMIVKIFEMGEFWKTADVQLGIDLKLFEDRI